METSIYTKLTALIFVGLVVVFIVDPLDRSTVSTPFCLGIILMALSLRQKTSLVVATSVIYSIFTVYALVRFHQYYSANVHTSPHPAFWLFQRIGLFLVLCGLSSYLAYFRTDAQRLISNIQNILGKLPAPVVISDAAGCIVYSNEALSAVFKLDPTEIKGKRYVDFMMSDIQEGKATRYYIELFEEEGNSVHELETKPFQMETKIKARVTCLGSGPNRMMVTVFNIVAPTVQPLP
jgi:PAS domain-containing protein